MSTDHDPGRQQIRELVKRAEAMVEAMEVRTEDGRWAMTAFSRFRLCELLEVLPYGAYDGSLDGDPVALLEEAAQVADELDVAIEEVSWRLALADALRTAAADIRMARDARDV